MRNKVFLYANVLLLIKGAYSYQNMSTAQDALTQNTSTNNLDYVDSSLNDSTTSSSQKNTLSYKQKLQRKINSVRLPAKNFFQKRQLTSWVARIDKATKLPLASLSNINLFFQSVPEEVLLQCPFIDRSTFLKQLNLRYKFLQDNLNALDQIKSNITLALNNMSSHENSDTPFELPLNLKNTNKEINSYIRTLDWLEVHRLEYTLYCLNIIFRWHYINEKINTLKSQLAQEGQQNVKLINSLVDFEKKYAKFIKNASKGALYEPNWERYDKDGALRRIRRERLSALFTDLQTLVKKINQLYSEVFAIHSPIGR